VIDHQMAINGKYSRHILAAAVVDHQEPSPAPSSGTDDDDDDDDQALVHPDYVCAEKC
jgi:hypothetical protein